jgi:hypothetical protein
MICLVKFANNEAVVRQSHLVVEAFLLKREAKLAVALHQDVFQRLMAFGCDDCWRWNLVHRQDFIRQVVKSSRIRCNVGGWALCASSKLMIEKCH